MRSVDDSLPIANMGLEEFADGVDKNEVFRDFPRS